MAGTAEVVIVGAGVVGASIAWHLAARGCRDVIVLEREPDAGRGSTGRATGGFRSQFGTPANIGLSLLSREKLGRFGDEVGGDSGYRPCGYLYLAVDEEELASLAATQAVQHAAGVAEARIVGPDEVARLNPAVAQGGVAGGAFCPTDGFIRPLGILEGYRAAAARAGVEFRYGVEVRRIVVEEGNRRVAGVETRAGTIETRRVVDAAGAWAAPVAATAGVTIPVEPLRRQVAATEPFADLPEDMPMTVWVGDGFHTRVRDGRVLLLWPRPAAGASPTDTSFDPAWLEGLHELAARRLPPLAAARIDLGACWAGLYEMSPDNHALLGEAPGVEGLFLANGSSGHGVMHSPAIGQLLAELILDGEATSLDLRPFRPQRFAEGEPNVSTGYL